MVVVVVETRCEICVEETEGSGSEGKSWVARVTRADSEEVTGGS